MLNKDEDFKNNLYKIIEISKTSEENEYAISNAISLLNAVYIPFACKDYQNIRIPGANL